MRRYLSNLWAEFKLFAFQGSLIELAVAVVLGAALSGLIHAVVVDVISPTITYAVTAARTAESTAAQVAHAATGTVGPTAAPAAVPADAPAGSQVVAVGPPSVARVGSTLTSTTAVEADNPKAIQFQWYVGRYPVGHLVGEVLNFAIVAFVVFLVAVKVLGGLVPPPDSLPAAGEAPTKECPECLSIIPVRARRCSHCTARLEGRQRLHPPTDGPGRRRPMMRPTQAR